MIQPSFERSVSYRPYDRHTQCHVKKLKMGDIFSCEGSKIQMSYLTELLNLHEKERLEILKTISMQVNYHFCKSISLR